ncbi:hypothetical protein DCS_07605 [Drechmeria coniospora]|uniref:Uncharacterized protein n=1 Tax=Drechmeria coniospora TaxID=98403 RepID=A0A151GEZ9_DRECN|nr:hypothetical protein DCS_07605 [Drechmeria coniospora]KYK55642.1 hypothetical protein DCS_07605 [Drechmeria coniospora]
MPAATSELLWAGRDEKQAAAVRCPGAFDRWSMFQHRCAHSDSHGNERCMPIWRTCTGSVPVCFLPATPGVHASVHVPPHHLPFVSPSATDDDAAAGVQGRDAMTGGEMHLLVAAIRTSGRHLRTRTLTRTARLWHLPDERTADPSLADHVEAAVGGMASSGRHANDSSWHGQAAANQAAQPPPTGCSASVWAERAANQSRRGRALDAAAPV